MHSFPDLSGKRRFAYLHTRILFELVPVLDEIIQSGAIIDLKGAIGVTDIVPVIVARIVEKNFIRKCPNETVTESLKSMSPG